VDKIEVRVETEINLTEDLEKVKNAVTNLFDNMSFEVRSEYNEKRLVAEATGLESLVKFRRLLSLERIRDAARRVFIGGSRSRNIKFFLNKQVAFTGHVSFSEEFSESPLGPIKVTIKCNDPQTIIEWLAARTS
jgi:uncharacterized protein